MNKIIEIKKRVFNKDAFEIGDFYKFKLKDGDEFELRQLVELGEEYITFSIGKYKMTYSLEAFENAENMEVNHYASYRDVLKLI